jgi:hypothetical protein
MHAKAAPLIDSIVLLEQVVVARLRRLFKTCAADAGNWVAEDLCEVLFDN